MDPYARVRNRRLRATLSYVAATLATFFAAQLLYRLLGAWFWRCFPDGPGWLFEPARLAVVWFLLALVFWIMYEEMRIHFWRAIRVRFSDSFDGLGVTWRPSFVMINQYYQPLNIPELRWIEIRGENNLYENVRRAYRSVFGRVPESVDRAIASSRVDAGSMDDPAPSQNSPTISTKAALDPPCGKSSSYQAPTDGMSLAKIESSSLPTQRTLQIANPAMIEPAPPVAVPTTASEMAKGCWDQVGHVQVMLRFVPSTNAKHNKPLNYAVSADRTTVAIIKPEKAGGSLESERFEAHEIFDVASSQADVIKALEPLFMASEVGEETAIISEGCIHCDKGRTLFGAEHGLLHEVAMYILEWTKERTDASEAPSGPGAVRIVLGHVNHLHVTSLLGAEFGDEWESIPPLLVQDYEGLVGACKKAQKRLEARRKSQLGGDLVCQLRYELRGRERSLWLLGLARPLAHCDGDSSYFMYAPSGASGFALELQQFATCGRVLSKRHKLTRTLQKLFDSAGKIALISHLTANVEDVDHTVATLRYTTSLMQAKHGPSVDAQATEQCKPGEPNTS